MTKNRHSSPLIWDSRSVICSLIKTCVCSKKHTQHLSIKPKWLQTHRGYLNLYYFSPCDSLVRAGLLPLPPTSLLEDLNNSCYLRYLCIRLFMKAQMCMCRAAAWEANEDIRWVQGSERGDFFFVIASWNWILFKSSFHKRPWPMHVVQRPKGQRKACSAFVSVPDWLDVNLTLSLRRPNNKKGWKTRGASGRGFPQPPSLISFTASFSDGGQKPTE